MYERRSDKMKLLKRWQEFKASLEKYGKLLAEYHKYDIDKIAKIMKGNEEIYWRCLAVCNHVIIEALEMEDHTALRKMGKAIASTAINIGKLHDVKIDNVIVISRIGNIVTTARAQDKEQGIEFDKHKYAIMCQDAWQDIMGMRQGLGL